jgi:hypothetical protein
MNQKRHGRIQIVASFEGLVWHLVAETEENHGTLYSGYLVSRDINHRIFRVQVNA